MIIERLLERQMLYDWKKRKTPKVVPRGVVEFLLYGACGPPPALRHYFLRSFNKLAACLVTASLRPQMVFHMYIPHPLLIPKQAIKIKNVHSSYFVRLRQCSLPLCTLKSKLSLELP